ncbi:MAG: ABC transporter substrate-binding protein, partial [Dehalococcoidia bacterium]
MGGQEDKLLVNVHLFYTIDLVTPDAAVDDLLPQFLGRAGFRTLEETPLTLVDGTSAFQITYLWSSEEGTMNGALFAVVRGSQNFVIVVEGPEEEFEANVEEVRALLFSFQLEEPSPAGIPRSQALTLYYDDGPLTLDPAIAQESKSIQYITQIFSGLISFDSDLVLTSNLARAWEVNGDGTVYTFTLHEDARFHDGKAVTAEDIKFSWERAVTLAAQGLSSTAGTYLNDIVGVAEVMAGEAEEISGLEVVDANTLRVTVDAPKVYFLSKLAHPVTYVVDRLNIEAESAGGDQVWWAEPNGTGPFSLNTWEPGIVMVLDANEDYYGPTPSIPHVVFRLYGAVPRLMYEAGEIDVAPLFSDELDDVRDPENPLSQELVELPELSIFYVGFASDKPPFDDPKVRQAFLMATDRAKLLRDVFNESQEIAHGFLPPGLPGYNPDIPTIPFDPEAARLLLADSSYGGPDGLPPIIYTASGVTTPGPVVESLLEMWRENLGVEVVVQLRDPGLYFYILGLAVDNLYDYGWIADYPDPHNFLDVLFHSGA